MQATRSPSDILTCDHGWYAPADTGAAGEGAASSLIRIFAASVRHDHRWHGLQRRVQWICRVRSHFARTVRTSLRTAGCCLGHRAVAHVALHE